ncbi:MAG TPA: IS4 family transposase [Verrucomicrobiales bacterium]|nr:IS4 family transposase [Verrucomicrobiales bacterium]
MRHKAATPAIVSSLGWEDKGWIDQELDGAYFQDVRLGQRLRTLLGLMSNGLGQSIPLACQDWANTKAAYRFFSNPRITEEEILSGHFASTQARAAAISEPLLVLHDTTEFSFQGAGEAVGLLTALPIPSHRRITIRGLLMHSSLALTTDGIPLGLLSAKFWTRKNFKGTNALKRKINPTRIPIHEKESFRWLENIRQATGLLAQPGRCIHIADREGDIYELFDLVRDLGAKFVVRTCVDRLAEDGDTTVAGVMKHAEVKGVHRIEVRDQDGQPDHALLEIKYEQLVVRPPLGKRNDHPELALTAIHAREKSKARRRVRIEWKLMTNLAVHSLEDALEKLRWYALRWKIEVFHKILKSGCRAEQSKLRTTERLSKLIAVFCILSWRVFWMTMVGRSDPQTTPETVLTNTEMTILDQLMDAPEGGNVRSNAGNYLIKIARLGGYLARASDPPPGNLVMWRGVSRLADIHLGFLMAKGNVGN